MVFKTVSHVLFDLDGLLIDSEKMYTKAFETVCTKYEKTFTWEINSSILATHEHECADKIIQILELPITREQFMDGCREVLTELFPDMQLMPGAMKLVSHLHNKNIPIALATSSSEENVNMKMQNHREFISYFHHLTMGSSDPEVTKGKPDPAIFLVCASRFDDKPKPEMCLVFEDSLNGVKAAYAAKMQVVAVPDPRVNKQELNIATLVLNSLEEFQPELFGLPAYD